MVISGIGFVAMLIGNTFLFDKYDAYGEVPIPGSSSLQLPAGDVTVTFHTIIIGGTSGGGGLPVPPLKYRIGAPEGVEEPVLTEDYGSTTTVNNDARVRLGFLHVPVEGTYDVKLEGNVSAYLNPTLAFGHGSPYTSVPWLLAAVFGVAVVVLVIARVWAARVRRDPYRSTATRRHRRRSACRPTGRRHSDRPMNRRRTNRGPRTSRRPRRANHPRPLRTASGSSN